MTVPEMLKMSQADLDDLFTKSPAGNIPQGEAKGTAIVAPGTTYSENIATLQGRKLDGRKGVHRPRLFETSLLAHWIRDEIREIAPRTNLGKVYWSKKRLIDFAFEFPAA